MFLWQSADAVRGQARRRLRREGDQQPNNQNDAESDGYEITRHSHGIVVPWSHYHKMKNAPQVRPE
jgi:hypothetical protein